MQSQNNSRISETVCSTKWKNRSPVSQVKKSVTVKNNKSEVDSIEKKEAIAVKYPKRITDILMDWIIQNKEDPFPDQQAIADLMVRTNLDQSQIINWTTNVRKRNMKATCEGLKKPHHFIDFLFLAQDRDNRRKVDAVAAAKEQPKYCEGIDVLDIGWMDTRIIHPSSDTSSEPQKQLPIISKPCAARSQMFHQDPPFARMESYTEWWQNQQKFIPIAAPDVESGNIIFEPMSIDQAQDFSILLPWSVGVASDPSGHSLDNNEDHDDADADDEISSITMKAFATGANCTWISEDCNDYMSTDNSKGSTRPPPATAGEYVDVVDEYREEATIAKSHNCFDRYNDFGELNMHDSDDEFASDRSFDDNVGTKDWAF